MFGKCRRNFVKSPHLPVALIFLALAAVLALAPAVLATGGTWPETGALNTARQEHTATLLPNGKVLVVGGWGSTNMLASCELYDPATGTWAPTGSLTTARYEHTATLLPNGKVLVAGGWGNDGALNSAELYDPVTGLWSSGGTFTGGRWMHTATLLQDGRVLVVGGSDISGLSQATAQLYTPNSGAGLWAGAAALTTARNRHTATLLRDGRVLVAGGYNSNTGLYLNTSQVYTPGAGGTGPGTWASQVSFTTARQRHTATLLSDGAVLVAGGEGTDGLGGLTYPTNTQFYDPTSDSWSARSAPLPEGRSLQSATLLPNGKVLLAAGYNGAWMSSAGFYGPWVSTSSLTTARIYHTATLLPNGQVLVTGGRNSALVSLASCEILDYAAGVWGATGSLNQARYDHTATLLPGGKVLAAGGVQFIEGLGYSNTTSAELFNPTGGEGNGGWDETGPLNTARSGHTATLLANGLVLVAGGSHEESGDGIVESELYLLTTGTWINTSGFLHTGRGYHTATLLANGQVLVAGGFSGTDGLAGAELFNPATGDHGAWTEIESMSQPRDTHTATLLPSGKVLVAGGYYYDYEADIEYDLAGDELYDPATGHWTATGDLNHGRYGHTATLLPNGQVLAAGGYNQEDRYLVSCELYNPATGNWTPTGDLNYGRNGHRATLLANGKVLVTGGYGDDGYLFPNCELYDPATGAWTETDALYSGPQGRGGHTATLLLGGKVLAAAGNVYGSITNTAALYDPGLGFTETWRPTISSISASVTTGGQLALNSNSGTWFRGVSGGSGGGTNDSPTDYPLVQVRRLDSERLYWVLPSVFGNDYFTSRVFQDIQSGYHLVTVFASGIPSVSQLVQFNNTGSPTAVQLKSFTATGGTSYVQLNWQTGSELNTAAFRLWRRDGSGKGGYTPSLALIPARGGPVRGAKYSYKDTQVVNGRTYDYKLEDIARNGDGTFHGPVSATVSPELGQTDRVKRDQVQRYR